MKTYTKRYLIRSALLATSCGLAMGGATLAYAQDSEDDASDELTNDPVFKAVLHKDALASQPTVSRFFNRMDEDTLNQFLAIARVLRRKIYSVQMPQAVILDLDSTLLDAYGRQQPDFVSLYPYLSSFC